MENINQSLRRRKSSAHIPTAPPLPSSTSSTSQTPTPRPRLETIPTTPETPHTTIIIPQLQIPQYSPSHFPPNFHRLNVLRRTNSSPGQFSLSQYPEVGVHGATVRRRNGDNDSIDDDSNNGHDGFKFTLLVISFVLIVISLYALFHLMLKENSKKDYFFVMVICIVIYVLNFVMRMISTKTPEKYKFYFAVANTIIHAALVQMYVESTEFLIFFTIFAIALIVLAKSTAVDDPPFYMKAFVLQCTAVAVGYFTDTEVTDHVKKAVCLTIVSLVGFAVLSINDWSTRFALGFILQMVPVDFRGG